MRKLCPLVVGVNYCLHHGFPVEAACFVPQASSFICGPAPSPGALLWALGNLVLILGKTVLLLTFVVLLLMTDSCSSHFN